MVRVKINGEQELSDIGTINTMADLVELIKAQIDPDSIITSLVLEGKELSDADWRVPLSVQGDAMLEVTTGSKEDYVSERLSQAGGYLEQIAEQLQVSAQLFRQGSNEDANNSFSQSMDDLKAFFNWYSAVLQVLAETAEQDVNSYSEKITPILQISEEIVQHQLHQSWILMADVIDGKLVPHLEEIRSFCLSLQSKYCEQ
ncbi:MAG: hypothetical protein KDD66_12440 [Bdellovibrionales bacterium]|nr:hypothetical protein [Bdellovibrionales bacterium]